MLTIILAIIAAVAISAAAYLLHLLLIERKVSDKLFLENEELASSKSKLTRLYIEKNTTVLRLEALNRRLVGDLGRARVKARESRRLMVAHIDGLSRELRGAHALIELFLIQFEGLEQYVHIDRKEARRLFVVQNN